MWTAHKFLMTDWITKNIRKQKRKKSTGIINTRCRWLYVNTVRQYCCGHSQSEMSREHGSDNRRFRGYGYFKCRMISGVHRTSRSFMRSITSNIWRSSSWLLCIHIPCLSCSAHGKPCAVRFGDSGGQSAGPHGQLRNCSFRYSAPCLLTCEDEQSYWKHTFNRLLCLFKSFSVFVCRTVTAENRIHVHVTLLTGSDLRN